MSKIKYNRDVFKTQGKDSLLNEWDPHVGNLPDDTTFEEKKRAVIDYNRHNENDLSPGWAYRKTERIKAWKQKRLQMIKEAHEKLIVEKIPARTQCHVPEVPAKPIQFKAELKQIKARVQSVSRKNKAGDPKHSNHANTRALNDMEAAYCRVNKLDYTVKQLARKFNVSERCVTRCVKGETYKHLNAKFKPWF